MNLYDKIYNAINEGMIKSLHIDDDQPVNYSHSKVNNSIYSKNQFNNSVKKFLVNSTVKNYNEVLKYSMNGMHQYKMKNFNILKKIFYKVSRLTDNIDLSWIDMSNAVTFIMKNGTEELLSDIDNMNNVMLIKFNNINDIDHSIIMHKDLLITDNIQWSNNKVNTKALDKNDGFKNTYNTKNIIKDLNNYPAFEYCINQSIEGYEAYLPAIAELEFLNDNEKLMNYILKYVKGKYLDIYSGSWWSSTQYSVTNAWILNYCASDNYSKISSRQVLPLFRKIDLIEL